MGPALSGQLMWKIVGQVKGAMSRAEVGVSPNSALKPPMFCWRAQPGSRNSNAGEWTSPSGKVRNGRRLPWRKIAVILHRMWVDGTTYRWTDAQPTAAQV
jgi:hypothetical protein